MRASASGPLVADKLAASFGFGYTRRDGFTVNQVTGNDLDSRSATFGKAQLMWVPARNWEARVIVSAERDRDGDYAPVDLDAAAPASLDPEPLRPCSLPDRDSAARCGGRERARQPARIHDALVGKEGSGARGSSRSSSEG